MELLQPPDVYFKKVVPLRHRRRSLSLRVSQELFSSFDVDVGTRLLLQTLADERFDRLQSVLDLGCGYGPLGLALRGTVDQRSVHCVDRDALAVAYTRQNALLNGLADVQVYAGLGYDDLPNIAFDLIVSNIPAKVGPAAIKALLCRARRHLAPGGMVAVVVISPLQALAEATLTGTPGVEVLTRQARPGHVAFHYRFTGEQGEREWERDDCLLYTSPSPRDRQKSRMPSSA